MYIKTGVILAYVAMIIGVGIFGMKRTRSFSDFFLGGGNVGPLMTAFSYATAYFSAVLFVGFAGKIGWGFGYSGLWVAFFNAIIGVFGVWFFLGYRIKKMSREMKVQTMAEYLEKRYKSKFLKLFASICIFVFFIPYSAAVFMGLSYLFKVNFNLNYTVALVLMGSFTALYMVMGGYKSMAIIDVIFGGIMLVGVFILMVCTLNEGGGLVEITNHLSGIDPELTSLVGPPGVWTLFCLVFLTSVAPFGMPQLVQKFYAVKDKRSINIGMVASTCFAFFIGGVAYFTGSTTRIFLTPATAPGAFSNGKPLFDALMPELLVNVIPESLAILMLLLVLSASMSTLAALVLISSSSVVKDVYAGFINRDAEDVKLTRYMRLGSCFFILLSVILAYMKPASIVAILGISWGAIASVFLGPFIWGLFSNFANRYGAIASSVIGLGTCLFLYFNGSSSPEAGTIGMIVSLTANPVFSFFFRGKEVREEGQGKLAAIGK